MKMFLQESEMNKRLLLFVMILAFVISPVDARARKKRKKPLPPAPKEWTVGPIQGTSLFPKVKKGEPLKQIVRVHIGSPAPSATVRISVTMDGREVYNEPLGSVGSWVTKDLPLPENDRPAKLKVTLLAHDGKNLASGDTELKVPRKLTLYFVSFSHQDLGCGDYPFRRRTRVRHNHIFTSLEHFRQSDSWDPDSRFRFVVETSEGITSFLAMHNADVIEELQRRILEGRIQIGSLLSTANTERLGHECMARQFYLANRHTCDLLSVPPGKAAVLTDVLGMTWPLATFCKSAGVALIHGHNGNLSTCLVEPGREDFSYWLAPDEGRTPQRHPCHPACSVQFRQPAVSNLVRAGY